MSIEPSIKMIRNGYETTVIKGTMLPTDIVWRRKDCFSDGVLKGERPWYKIIEDYTK